MVTVAKPLSEFALASNKLQLDQFVKRRRILAWTQICKDCVQVLKKKYLFSTFSSLSCNLMLLILRAIATDERRLTHHVTVCPQSTYNNLLVSLESLVVPPTPQMVQASADCCLRPADDSRASRYNIVGLA